jgi:hypothetical protein
MLPRTNKRNLSLANTCDDEEMPKQLLSNASKLVSARKALKTDENAPNVLMAFESIGSLEFAYWEVVKKNLRQEGACNDRSDPEWTKSSTEANKLQRMQLVAARRNSIHARIRGSDEAPMPTQFRTRTDNSPRKTPDDVRSNFSLA